MTLLTPFSSASMRLYGEVSVRGMEMHLRFKLDDPQKSVLDSFVPGKWRGEEVRRSDGLWKTTCLEAFWGVPGQPGYWELNFAASSPQWNLYRFNEYREPQPPAPSSDYELLELSVGEDSLACSLRGQQAYPTLEANLCAVLRTREALHYFAAAHAATKPDFHDRKSFRLNPS
jgi:hypothetical protein